MQKGRASLPEAQPFCIDLVLQGKTLCCWGMQQLANVSGREADVLHRKNTIDGVTRRNARWF